MDFEDIIPRSVQQNVAEAIADCFQNQLRKGWDFCTDSLLSRLLWETRSPHSEDTHAALDRSCGGELSLCPQPRLSLEMDPVVPQFSLHMRLNRLDCTLTSDPKSEPPS